MKKYNVDFFNAIRENDIDAVRLFLKSDMNIDYGNDDTALIWAARSGNKKIVAMLSCK